MLGRVLSLFTLSFFLHQAAASLITDTISPTQPLKDGQILTSAEGNNFVLGFFSPGNSTQLRYVGIWYQKVSTQTIVWVANRDRPINGSNGVLSIANDGNLVLPSHNSTLWSTSIPRNQDPTNTKAQLLDSGNLIVFVGGNQSDIPWQSFDHLTHVLLPGSVVKLERRTGLSRFLSSWRSNDDPGVGSYTFRVGDPKGGLAEFYVYKDGSLPIWRSGPYVGERWSGVPPMTEHYLFNHTVYESPEEVYFGYTMRNNSIISHFIMDGESETLKGETWHQSTQQWIKFFQVPQDDCDKYANCGDFGLCNSTTDLYECSCFESYEPKSPRDWYLRDASDGCVRMGNVSMCQNGEGFLKLANVKVPDTSTAKRNMSMSLAECREECLNNCSCLAFTSATDGGVGELRGPTFGCILLYGALIDSRLFTSGGQDLYLRVDALELAKSLDKSKDHLEKKQLVILLVCIVLALFTFVMFLAYWFYMKNRREWREQEERSLWLGEAGESNSTSPVFRFSTITDATQNFGSFIGEGGFGSVYRGKLSNGQEIAVKRLSKNSGQGINEFKNEVRLISKLQHRNLVKTLGCCVRGEEKMLVYEFLPNKSLDKYIFDEKNKTVLDWSKRYEIIVGIARGVLYLHQDSRLKIIHRDLKASNILLDGEMNPKISDFGLARIFGNDQSEANTNRVVGTYGYMSPEYAMEGLFSIKSDVFSFGVIMLEIISGQRSSRYQNDQLSATNLSGYVWKLWQDRNAIELVDKSVVSTICGYEDDVLRCIQIGLLCVQENPNERPTMLEVTFMLSNKASLPSPKEPAFIFKGNQPNKGDSHSSSTEVHSVNAFTETVVYPR